MWSQIIFFIGVFCAFNVSAIAIKDYVDDEGGQVNSKQNSVYNSFNNLECDQRCKSLGGVCVNGRCQCISFLTTIDTCAIFRDVVLQLMCQPRDCNERCQKFGHSGGVCVNGHCKCYRFIALEGHKADNSEDNEIEEAVEALNRIAEESIAFHELSEDIVAVNSCNNQECDQRCRRLQFPGGVCVNGRCKCDNFLDTKGHKADNSEDDDIEETVEALKRIAKASSAMAYAAVMANDAENHTKAQYSNDEDNSLVEESIAFHELSEDIVAVNSCNNQECDQRCRRLQFPGGVCVNGRCKCDNFLDTKGHKADNSEDDEIEEAVEAFNRIAEGHKADNREDDEIEDAVAENKVTESESTYSFKFKPGFYNNLCRFLGFEGGNCINGRCKCSEKGSVQ